MQVGIAEGGSLYPTDVQPDRLDDAFHMLINGGVSKSKHPTAADS